MNTCIFQLACLSVVFAATSAGTLQNCHPDTGPAGLTRCFLQSPYYAVHQHGTCRSDVYIRQKSKGRHECRNRTATYCYYQCMIERYDLDSGPVYDDCQCDANSRLPQPQVILPAACYRPAGTDCGWYRQCLAKMFPCTGHDDYAISYGERICNLYTHSTLHFSPKALQWIGAVEKCLQLALVPALHFGLAKPTCKDIRRMAFDTHVLCYVAPSPGQSFCNLSLADWARVFWTIKSGFLPPTFAGTLKAAVEVLTYCGVIWGTQLPKYVSLCSLGVQLVERTGRRQSASTEMLSADELAHAVVLHVSSSLRWSHESTVDWYAFAVNTSAFQQSPKTPSTDQTPGRQLMVQLFVVDRVDVGLLNVTDAVGRRRLNETITQLADVIERGLTGTVANFRYGVTSLRQCASGEGISDGCSNGTVVATGQPDLSDSATVINKILTSDGIQ